MQLFLGYVALFTEAMVAGGLTYTVCLWLFSYSRILPTLVFWALILFAGWRLIYLPILIIVLITSAFFAAFGIHFMSRTIPDQDQELNLSLAYVALVPTHIISFALCLCLHYYLRIDRFFSGDPSLTLLLLAMLSPTLAAFQIWWWKKTKWKPEDGF